LDQLDLIVGINWIRMEQKMDQNKTDQILRLLLAKMDDMKSSQHEMLAGLKKMNAKMDAWLGKTEVCLEEEREPTPKETDVVVDRQEVHKEGTEDRAGDLRLVKRRHRQRKKRAQIDGEPRQKFAAFRRRSTRRAVPALLKGHVRKGLRRHRRSGVRGPGRTPGSRIENRGLKERRTKDKAIRGIPGKRTCEGNRRTRPVFGNGLRQSTLVRNGMRSYAAFRQKFAPEAVRTAFKSSIRLREPGNGTLWKCRPPPKRKR
jgi:hypothetical protein